MSIKYSSNPPRIAEISVSQEGEQRILPIFKFKDAGLHPIMLKNVEMAGYKTPTPIQKYCIPAIKMGHDLIAIAQTGQYFPYHLTPLKIIYTNSRIGQARAKLLRI